MESNIKIKSSSWKPKLYRLQFATEDSQVWVLKKQDMLKDGTLIADYLGARDYQLTA